MSERYEALVMGIIGVGPHPTRTDIYQIQVHAAPSAEGPQQHVTLLLPQAQAVSLARMLQENPPRATLRDHVLDDIAGIDT